MVTERNVCTDSNHQEKSSVPSEVSCAWRKKKYSPWLVVPHPKNRGSDVVGPVRLRELGSTLAVEGYDAIEANTNGVVVQQKPSDTGEPGTSFQDVFSTSVKADREIAEVGPGGTIAIVGSLSHSHLNCLMRNVSAGLRGCECMEPTVVGKRKNMKCACKARPILDEDGNYSMDLLQDHDRAWWTDVQTGLDWEELSWQMDVEEPDAALVISVALNKRNEAAMNTGHLEIFIGMTNLLNPDPDTGVVMYEPVRDQLVDVYGPSVNDVDFIFVFRFAMAAGGKMSIWIARLKNSDHLREPEETKDSNVGVWSNC